MATTPRLTVDTAGVRHRLVWGGVYLGLIATLLIGLGLTITPMWTWVLGCVLLAVSGVVALVGGVLRDVEVREHHMPIEEIKAIEAEALPASSHGPLELESGEVDEQAEEGPRLDRLGGMILLLMSGWLFLAPYLLGFALTQTAERAIYHATGLSIVTGLVAFKILSVGPSRIAAGIAALSGAVFLVYTLARPSVDDVDQLVFLVSGAVVILGAVLSATPLRRLPAPA